MTMELTRTEKAKLTAKWATTMTKWHIGYASKEVRPIFVEEADEIVVVTVYTYYS